MPTIIRPSRLLVALGCTWMLAAQSTAAPPPNLSDRLMSELLDRHTEGKVYEQANNPWPGGNFKIEVYKDGQPRVTSGLHSIHLQMPLEVRISGDAASSFLQMKLACTSRFTTIGEVELTPRNAGSVDHLTSNITLPIPAAEADCGTMKLPIDAYLKAVVAQSKPKWEQDINTKINSWLSEGAAGKAAARLQ